MYEKGGFMTRKLRLLTILWMLVGTAIMFFHQGNTTGLSAGGLMNLRYFTVLSNEFCGIVAIVSLIRRRKGKKAPLLAEYMAAVAVGLTFLTVAVFLGPVYGHIKLYKYANFFFHLVLPVTAMAAFVLDGEEDIPFRYTFYTVIPAVVYGIGYVANILINGKGEWPDTNDWYGFLNWGIPGGVIIFLVIGLATWGLAVFLRFCRRRICLRRKT